MLDRYIGLGVTAITLAFSAQAQTVSFSSPVPWVTQRNDTIAVKAQVDTAQIKQKSLVFKLTQVSKGKKKEIASKKVTVSDVSVDVSFGSIKKQLLGGDEYLQVEWSIPGSTEKGTVEPIGIVPESVFKDLSAVTATKVKDVQGLSSLKDEQFQTLGDIKIAAAWNMDACFFAIKKGAGAKSVIKFAFDGKNGKSAFLSYPDRIVSFNAQNDTINAIHYTRELKNDTLLYRESNWNSSIKKEVKGDVVMITVPWSDVGVIPFDDRTVGFAMFAENSNGKVTQSNPANAKLFIPGTWTNLLLAK